MLSILNKILLNSQNIADVFKMEVFTQFMDLFRDEFPRKQSAKLVLNALISKHNAGCFNDIQFAHQVYFRF